MENNVMVPLASQTATPEGLYLYGLGQAINNLTIRNKDGLILSGNNGDYVKDYINLIHNCAMDVIKECNNKKQQ